MSQDTTNSPRTTALEHTTLGDVEVLDHLGEGGRSTVYRALWEGREIALKVYKERALERHARKHPLSLEQFEHSRNLAFYQAPGMARYVAEPLGTLVVDGVRAFRQERLDGELYYFYYKRRGGDVPPELFEHVEYMVALHHEAGLYDADLHSMNVMVVEDDDGEPIPKLFDFNLVPFHLHPPNPIVRALLKIGLMSCRSRDLRKLKSFHNFEPKVLKYYK